MVKTIRISDENHKELLKIQGEIQSETGEFTSMDDAIAGMVEAYKKKHR
jgi:predicted CopG family antitoxin